MLQAKSEFLYYDSKVPILSDRQKMVFALECKNTAQDDLI